ncbi:DUF7225 domain-containing protein [Domibacillus enclensis]|uniref:Uncharacterized protein n=1 Tax=Domibacillus enclensis TaxID=1017273 RepID=A0A1N6V782_9BACI|nr:hypothetical protein [Domibacillus enclensis]OXS78714.1 hypothetical protein B1B05_08990 [Domibacillus enclensis]SIQ73668.1 hypothetical protein SAMN05443094_103474 [Domibacillus enclensis]
MADRVGNIVKSSEVKKVLLETFGTKPSSVLLSDYCYNRYNAGISFKQHLFVYMGRNAYKYIGERAPYTGFIFQKPKNEMKEHIVGEWINGQYSLFEKPVRVGAKDSESIESISREHLEKLYEEYFDILTFEMAALQCKPTELRHLIGRLGEFYCALQTDGELARETNQHGFDVVSNGRKISVKTTAQITGFIPINQNTFHLADDFFIVQYTNHDFHLLFYRPKEEVPIARKYEKTYEVDIHRLKNGNMS